MSSPATSSGIVIATFQKTIDAERLLVPTLVTVNAGVALFAFKGITVTIKDFAAVPVCIAI